MEKAIIRYSLQIISVCLVGFGLHLLVLYGLGLPLFDHMIVIAYAGNILLAIGIVSALIILAEALASSLGFLFLAGSGLKFVFFFLVFYSTYKQDGTIQRVEFASFFVPYALALMMETKVLINKLSK